MVRKNVPFSNEDRFKDGLENLFPKGYELVPQLNELYELRLALMESGSLSPHELIERGAYFQSINGKATYHYQMCSGSPLNITTAGNRRQNFFKTNIFKTGYATHGFFPYRGKFHPQMVKALLNVIGVKPGETVLDPMMGSGTTVVEASTIGINSIGLDISPFCAFMAQAKVSALSVEASQLDEVVQRTSLCEKLYKDFQANLRQQLLDNKTNPLRRVAALAYLDALGYCARSSRMNHNEAFKAILKKYAEAINKYQIFSAGLGLSLGKSNCMVEDARSTTLPDDSVHGVLFSPPYSFAVDYVENDIPQLDLMGSNVNELRSRMVGLRGKKGVEQVLFYLEDIEAVLRECHRVLLSGRYCVAVVGSNSKQLYALRERSALKNLEPSLEEVFVNRASNVGLEFVSEIRRQVTGIANSLREESILILKKPANRDVSQTTKRRTNA